MKLLLLGPLLGLLLLGPLGSCGLFSPGLASESPPLVDMEEPLDLYAEPDDEAERQGLQAGSFSGVYVEDSRETLEALLGEGEGVVVSRVVENSPGDAAGLEEGDLILLVVGPEGEEMVIADPSQWRAVELETEPGSRLVVVFDRANVEREVELVMVPRLRIPERGEVERFREEQRVGVVLRTATEVESRGAGLGPGGGAVVVGLSRRSPWRSAGIQFEDLVVAVDGVEVSHPQVVLEAIRNAEGETLNVVVQRGEEQMELEAGLSDRESELQSITIPLLFSYESDRGASSTSLVFGLLSYESTEAAWEFGFLWFFSFGGGDADLLEEVRDDR